jgi:hypothetical protein
MADDHAQLFLRRTGGLAGLAMVASLDTRELDAAEAQRITAALDHVDLSQVGKGPPGPPGAADMHQYDLEIRRGDRAQAVSFSQRQMPAELAPVIHALMDRAEPSR